MSANWQRTRRDRRSRGALPPYPRCQICVSPEEFADTLFASRPKDCVHEGVCRRRCPVVGPGTGWLRKAIRQAPVTDAVDEALPKGKDGLRHVQDQTPRVLHNASTRLHHVALQANQVKATPGAVLVLETEHRHQVECQQRQLQHDLVLVEIGVREMRPNGLLELADPIFECPAFTITPQRGFSVEFRASN